MVVKIFASSWSAANLEQKVNDFISSNKTQIEIIAIKLSNSFGTYVPMIIYKQNK